MTETTPISWFRRLPHAHLVVLLLTSFVVTGATISAVQVGVSTEVDVGAYLRLAPVGGAIGVVAGLLVSPATRFYNLIVLALPSTLFFDLATGFVAESGSVGIAADPRWQSMIFACSIGVGIVFGMVTRKMLQASGSAVKERVLAIGLILLLVLLGMLGSYAVSIIFGKASFSGSQEPWF